MLSIEVTTSATVEARISLSNVEFTNRQRRISFDESAPLVAEVPRSPQPTYLHADPPASRIFVLAGQSNMVGRADPMLARMADDPAKPQIVWHNDLNFDGGSASDGYVELQPQQSGWRVDADGAPVAHWGPEASLSLGERVHFAKFAMGSTRLRDHWHPDEPGSHFSALVAFCRRALAEAPQPARFEGLFWLQGESDSGAAKHANAYAANFVSFVKALREALAAPQLPLVASHVVWPNGKKVGAVNAAISSACEEALDFAKCTTAEGLTVAADGHLDTASVLEVGHRMRAAYKELVGKPLRKPGARAAE